jgi:hypothetical protein
MNIKCFVGFEIVSSGMWWPFWYSVLTPYSGSELRACMAYSSTLKMEAVRYSESSVNFHRTTRRHILLIDVCFVLSGLHETETLLLKRLKHVGLLEGASFCILAVRFLWKHAEALGSNKESLNLACHPLWGPLTVREAEKTEEEFSHTQTSATRTPPRGRRGN